MTRFATLWSGIRISFWLTLGEIGLNLLQIASRHGAFDDAYAIDRLITQSHRHDPRGASPGKPMPRPGAG